MCLSTNLEKKNLQNTKIKCDSISEDNYSFKDVNLRYCVKGDYKRTVYD